MKRKTALIVGNWKMNPTTQAEAKTIIADIKKGTKNTGLQVAIAAPFPYLYDLAKSLKNSPLTLAAQDLHPEEKGAYTGEVSNKMLLDAGVTHVIVGHSERRAMGETDELVRAKIDAALKAKITPVVCVGESKRDSHGNFFSLVEEQVVSIFKKRSAAVAKKIVIAYEPIWAIGTGKTATPDDVEEMRLFIQKTLSKVLDRNTAEKVTIIYGGSVKPENCEALFSETLVNGFLPGGASLRPHDFSAIVKTVEKTLCK